MTLASCFRVDPNGASLSILVVDDDLRIREQVADYLTCGGHRIVQSASADDALRLLRQREDTFDCVFSDVQMPGANDGISLARWILRYRPATAVLLASGSVRAEDLAPELRRLVPVLAKPLLGRAVENQIISSVARMRLRQCQPLRGTSTVDST